MHMNIILNNVYKLFRLNYMSESEIQIYKILTDTHIIHITHTYNFKD